MRLKEQRLWDSMKKAMPRHLWPQRIENVVGDGIPDVLVMAPRDVTSWVELKAPIRPKRARTPLLGAKEGLRQSQINWHLKAATKNAATYILIRDDHKAIFMIPGRYADEVNNMAIHELGILSVASNWKEVAEAIQ